MRKVLAVGIAVMQPAFAQTTVVCAPARRLRGGRLAQKLAHSQMNRIVTSSIAVDAAFHANTAQVGSSQFRRGAGALYLTAAQQSKSTLISWDNEHLQRAGGITPDDWLEGNP